MELVMAFGCFIAAFMVILDCMFRADGLIIMLTPVVFFLLMMIFGACSECDCCNDTEEDEWF